VPPFCLALAHFLTTDLDLWQPERHGHPKLLVNDRAIHVEPGVNFAMRSWRRFFLRVIGELDAYPGRIRNDQKPIFEL
jgi:hypothetical protein